MTKYKMTISYDGTGYGGWQIQPNSTSIQSLVQNAMSTILREETLVTGSGRTDAGVHALGQVAHFQTSQTFSLASLQHSLNSILPSQIRVINIEATLDSFHARFSATGKIYHYHLHLDRTLNPFTRLYSLHVHHHVNINLLQEASTYFLGTKDFSAFANEAHRGSASVDAVRTLQRLDIVPQSGGVRLELEADGFLYKMVRNITGTLLDVCAGHIKVSSLPEIFAAKDRRTAGKTAPAHGLFLMQVDYRREPLA